MSDDDDLAKIKAELARRGALPGSVPVPVAGNSGNSDAFMVILAESVNHLAKAVGEMRVSNAKQNETIAALAAAAPRIRRIVRDADGNIEKIIEE